MKHLLRPFPSSLLAAAALASGCTADATVPPSGERPTLAATYAFDDAPLGALPAGWSVDATRPASPTATWAAIEDPGAPSGRRALALTRSEHGSDHTFNLCWTDTPFRDGTLHVAFRAVSGVVDQGGGPIWRMQDADNYYVCRANPLESNFRVYKVVGGERKQLASAQVDVPAQTWHTIDVEHVGDRIACSLNGARLLEVTDGTFAGAGAVGLWTKADAVTSFDELRVAPAR